MDYSEENVALAYERHPDTHPNQRRVWKTRGAIPNKYLDDSKLVRKRVLDLAPVEEKRQDRLALVLGSEKLYSHKIWELSGLPAQKWMVTDFIRGKVMLTEAERLQLTTEIQKLRAEVRNGLALAPGFARRKRVVALGRDLRLVKSTTFGAELGKLLAPARPTTPDEFSADQLQGIEEGLVLILLESSL